MATNTLQMTTVAKLTISSSLVKQDTRIALSSNKFVQAPLPIRQTALRDTRRPVLKIVSQSQAVQSDAKVEAAVDPYASLSNVCAVLGTQWGDEGKGKLVDILAQRYDVVARCQVHVHLLVLDAVPFTPFRRAIPNFRPSSRTPFSVM